MTLIVSVVLLVALAWYIWWNRSALHVAAAHRAFHKGDEPGTLAAFAKAEAAGRLGAEVTASYAYLLLKNGHVEPAGALLDTALNEGRRGRPLKDRERRLVQTYRALYLWKAGDLDDGADLLLALREAGYRTTALYGNLGYFLIEQGNLTLAEEVCREAAEWAPDGKVILDNLGTIHLKKQEWTQAAEVYERLLALNPKFPEAWWGAGHAAQQTGDTVETRRRWEHALTLPFNALTTVEKSEIEKALASLA